MQEWLFVKQGKQLGPVTVEELRRMAAAGELDRADAIWKPGMTTWTQAGSVEGIFAAAVVPLEYAGFGIRAAARVVDSLAYVFFGLLGGFAGGVILGVMQASSRLDPGWHDRLHEKHLSGILFSFAAMIFYQTICEGLSGASLGKLVCGLRVLDASGAPAGVTAALIRTIGFFPDSLFFGLVGYSRMSKSPLQQRYGDAWASTVVVKADSVPAGSKASTGIFLAALLAGAAFAAAWDMAGILFKVLG